MIGEDREDDLFPFGKNRRCFDYIYSHSRRYALIRQDKFECPGGYSHFRFSRRILIRGHDLVHAGSVRLDESHAIENVGKFFVTAVGNAEHHIVIGNASGETADGNQFNAVRLHAEKRACRNGIVPVNNGVEECLADGGVGIIPVVNAL